MRQGQQVQYRALIGQLTSCLLEQWHGSWRLSLLEQAPGGAVQVVGVRFHGLTVPTRRGDDGLLPPQPYGRAQTMVVGRVLGRDRAR